MQTTTMRASTLTLALAAAWSHPSLVAGQPASTRTRSKRERAMDIATGGGAGTIDGDLGAFDSIFAERDLTQIVGESR